MRNVMKLLVGGVALAGIVLSSGCKSDCEKAVDHMISLMEKDPAMKAAAEGMKKEKAKGVEECKKEAKPEVLKCMLAAKDIAGAMACDKKGGGDEAAKAAEELKKATEEAAKAGEAAVKEAEKAAEEAGKAAEKAVEEAGKAAEAAAPAAPAAEGAAPAAPAAEGAAPAAPAAEGAAPAAPAAEGAAPAPAPN